MLKVPSNLKEHSIKIVKTMVSLIIIFVFLLVLFGFYIIGQSPVVSKVNIPKHTPPPIVKIDTTLLQEERKKTILLSKQTDTFIKAVRKEVLTELKATKDSLKIMKITESLPVIMQQLNH